MENFGQILWENMPEMKNANFSARTSQYFSYPRKYRFGISSGSFRVHREGFVHLRDFLSKT